MDARTEMSQSLSNQGSLSTAAPVVQSTAICRNPFLIRAVFRHLYELIRELPECRNPFLIRAVFRPSPIIVVQLADTSQSLSNQGSLSTYIEDTDEWIFVAIPF